MDTSFVVNFLSEITYFLVVFGILLAFSIFKGRQTIINIIFGLYLALLISLEFPYYPQLLGSFGAGSDAIARLGIFLFFTALTTILCFRIMPDEFREKKLESFGRKLLLSFAATALIMVFSFNVLPVTEFLTPGTPIQSLFAPTDYFFWWLLLPIGLLFVL
ncbi:MAG: hypothetical protein RL538_240 [Candidatus Parcubacteria bacterium]|jgi:hypothetical protein